MSFIDVDQRRTTSADDPSGAILYRVQTSVTRAVGITADLFVYSVVDQSFQHVATLYDTTRWPVGYDAAVAQNLDFYRLSTVEVTFEEGATAQAAAEDHLRRLRLVVADHDAQPADFPGETIVTIEGDEGG